LDFMEAGGEEFAEGRIRAPATTVRSSESGAGKGLVWLG
jgi:hypothetical protein